ncbi:MAG: N-acetyltransferase family protein [Hyphomicrobiaceae bacterium]
MAEVSVYVAREAHGRGVGTALVAHLIDASETEGFWTLQAHALAANVASIGLFRRSGFRIVGTRERMGRVAGVWHDVVLLERRSSRTGGSGLPTYECPSARKQQ